MAILQQKKKKNLPPWSTNSRRLTSSLGDAEDGRGADFRGIPLDNVTALTSEWAGPFMYYKSQDQQLIC